MATSTGNHISVLVGPTCPACESDDHRWGAPLGALWHGQCRECGTEYRWYEGPDPSCARCGSPCGEHTTGETYCDDCQPVDCAFCGASTFRGQLSQNRACRTCELGEAA